MYVYICIYTYVYIYIYGVMVDKDRWMKLSITTMGFSRHWPQVIIQIIEHPLQIKWKFLAGKNHWIGEFPIAMFDYRRVSRFWERTIHIYIHIYIWICFKGQTQNKMKHVPVASPEGKSTNKENKGFKRTIFSNSRYIYRKKSLYQFVSLSFHMFSSFM